MYLILCYLCGWKEDGAKATYSEILWVSTLFSQPRYYLSGKYFTYIKLLGYLVELLRLPGFVDLKGQVYTCRNISASCNLVVLLFLSLSREGNYLVRTITGIRKLPKDFQKPRGTFIFLLSNNSSKSLFPVTNTLKGK